MRLIRRPSVIGAASLLVYALGFSLAYVGLDAGLGALLLFGSVQVTMLLAGFLKGERLSSLQALGLVAAVSGFLVQVAPGVNTPPLGRAALMALAGVA